MGLLEENKEKMLEWASNFFWTSIQMTKKISQDCFAVVEEAVCRIEETHWKWRALCGLNSQHSAEYLKLFLIIFFIYSHNATLLRFSFC